MWIESVKRRVASNHLEPTMDSLETAGIITDLITLIRKVKSHNPTSTPKDFLQIQKILTEELWNEHKKPEQKPEPPSSTSHSRLARSLSNSVMKNLSITSKNSQALNSTRRLDFLNTTTTSTTQKYKQQVSQDIAYMSTFSFPKGCGTFYKTRRLTSDKIPEVPGPGAYFCDPKMLAVNNTALFGFNPNSTRSSRRLSLSIGNILA